MRPVSKGGGHYAIAARRAVHQAELAAGTASKEAWANFGQECRNFCVQGG